MTPLLLAGLWVLAATAIAFLPMRYQIAPGLALLAAAAALVAWIARDHGPWIALAALLAVVSMFRKPLRHLFRAAVARLRGRGRPEGKA